MNRIFVLLTDRLPVGFEADLVAGDLVLVGPNLEFKHKLASVQKIGIPSSDVQRQLASQVTAALKAVPTPIGELLLAISNEVYSYVLRPLAAIIEVVNTEALKFPESKIFIVHAKRASKNVPLAGFATTESPRGSRSLLGAYVASQIKSIPALAGRTDFIEVKSDYFCREPLRTFTLRSLDLAVRIKFSFSLVVLGLLRPKQRAISSQSIDATLLVRAFHQARFAKRLCDTRDGHCIEILVIPQFLQGGLAHTLLTLIPLVGAHRVCLPTFVDVLKANRNAREDRRLLRGYAIDEFELKLDIAGRQMCFKLIGLARELSNLSVLLVYRRLLAAFISRRSIRRLLNFELVGRIAGLDRLAAEDADCKIATIQTAVVAEVAHPTFPHAHIFFADGPQTSERLSNVGIMKRGFVEYAGCPVPVRPLRTPTNPKVLAFFTQPYELEITISILSSLFEYSVAHGCRLLVKAHPRDESNYDDILGEDPKIAAMVDRNIDLEAFLLQCDVCITRTSSIARESLALGLPVILCLWSELDKGIRADYADYIGEHDHRAFSKQQLYKLLDDQHALVGAATNLRARLFGNLHIDDLVHRVCRV